MTASSSARSRPARARATAPAEAVTHAKAARIRRLAQRWLAERHAAGGSGFAEVRFDVLAVLAGARRGPAARALRGGVLTWRSRARGRSGCAGSTARSSRSRPTSARGCPGCRWWGCRTRRWRSRATGCGRRSSTPGRPGRHAASRWPCPRPRCPSRAAGTTWPWPARCSRRRARCRSPGCAGWCCSASWRSTGGCAACAGSCRRCSRPGGSGWSGWSCPRPRPSRRASSRAWRCSGPSTCPTCWPGCAGSTGRSARSAAGARPRGGAPPDDLADVVGQLDGPPGGGGRRGRRATTC